MVISGLAAVCERVASDFGEESARTFEQAVSLTRSGSAESGINKAAADIEMDLEVAIDTLVNLLTAVPEEKVRSAGYAELLLAYGRALLVSVRRQSLKDDVLAPNVQEELRKVAHALPQSGVVAPAAKPISVDENVGCDNSSKEVNGNTAERAAAADVSLEAVHCVPTSAIGEAEEKGGSEEGGANEEQDTNEENDVQQKSTGNENGSASSDAPKGVSESAVHVEGTGNAAEKENVRHDKKTNGDKSPSTKEDAKQDSDANAMQSSGEASARDHEQSDEITPVAPGAAEGEEEISTAELAWEQLETARTVLERLGAGHESRLSAVHETLGDFLVETDAPDGAAAAEYARAAELETRVNGSASRVVADLHHRRYLALRRAEPTAAICAMEASIAAFRAFVDAGKGDSEDTETVRMLQDDLAAFRAAVESAVKKGAASGPAGTAMEGKDGTAAIFASASAVERTPAPPVATETVAVTVKPRRRARPVPVPDPFTENAGSNVEAEGPPEKRAKISNAGERQRD